MQFKSYGEIENTYNNKMIKAVRDEFFDQPKYRYACFTKVDGSNLQCSLDEHCNFIVGTRHNLLTRESTFQGYERAMRNEDVESKLNLMRSFITLLAKNEMADIVEDGNFILTVYGELCGGMYRHPDVEKVKGATRVQGRIDYHPDNMWIPFDIVLRNEAKGLSYLMTTDEVADYCKMVGLPCQIKKFEGTFDECLNYQNDFIDDTGHILWNLPLIEGNITEGVVIKPVKPLWFRTGQRVIFKNKNNRFKERQHKSPKEEKELIPLNDTEKKYFEITREFLTENRLMSVFSKVEVVNEKAFGMILGMFLKDLWKDFDKEYAEEIKAIEDKTMIDEFNFAKVRKEISKEAIEMIRPIFVEKLNN